MKNKICSKCAKEKSVDDFSKNKQNKDGLQCSCKLCAKEYTDKNRERLNANKKEYYENNKTKILADKKIYSEKNKDAIAKTNEIYRKTNAEKITEWRKDNRDKILDYNKQYQKDNAEKIAKKAKEYKINNPEKILEIKRRYVKNNKHSVAWRSLLSSSLKSLGQKKNNRTQAMLGYSADELKQHLESLFTEGMSWNNHGEWHIDHIKGIVNWEPNTHPSIVNALSNLRPMWSTNRTINGVFYEGNQNRPKYH